MVREFLSQGTAGSIPNETQIIFSLFFLSNLIPCFEWVVQRSKSSSLAFKWPSYKRLKIYLWGEFIVGEIVNVG